MVAVALFWAAPVEAQIPTSSQGTTTFSPSLSVLGSLSGNVERVPDDSTQTNFFTATVRLPFQLNSRRWNLSAVYQPTYQYYREDESLTNLDHSGGFALRGVLSRRTELTIEGDAYVSNELRGLDATDVILPRTRQIRGGFDALLTQQLSTRDSLSFRGRYRRLRYPNGDLIDSDSADFGLGYGRALSARVTATLAGSAKLAAFDNGRRSRSTSVAIGGRFQVARATTLEVSGGILRIQQDVGEGWVDADQPQFSALASLNHNINRVGLRLRAQRDMGSSGGFGRATLRDRIVGSLSWGTNRWNLVGLIGYAKNASLDVVDGSRPSVNTLSACGRGAVRINPIVAMVGTVLYAHQIGEFAASQRVTDTFRISLGIRLQANGVPINTSTNQFRFDSISRDARAAC